MTIYFIPWTSQLGESAYLRRQIILACMPRGLYEMWIIEILRYRLNASNSLNNNVQVDKIVMDFSKAFDNVPRNILLNKLNRLDTLPVLSHHI